MWVILGHLVILWQVVFKLKMVKMKQCEITIQSNRCGKWPTWSKFITMSDWLCHKKYIIHNIKYQGFTFLSGCSRAISHFWLVAHVPLNNFPRIILIKCGSHLKYRTGGWIPTPNWNWNTRGLWYLGGEMTGNIFYSRTFIWWTSTSSSSLGQT